MFVDQISMIVAGAAGVGKTAFIKSISHKVRVAPNEHGVYRFGVFTTKGIFDIEAREASCAQSFKSPDAYVVMFDVNDQDTFRQAQAWCAFARNAHPIDVPLVLCGNKIDSSPKRGGRAVRRRHVDDVCARMDVDHYCEMSARDMVAYATPMEYVLSKLTNSAIRLVVGPSL